MACCDRLLFPFTKKLKVQRRMSRRNTDAGCRPSSKPQMNNDFNNSAKIFDTLQLNAAVAYSRCPNRVTFFRWVIGILSRQLRHYHYKPRHRMLL
jgi:hypothetical protein